MFSFLPPSEGPPQPQLCAFKHPVNQQVASSITALLCQRAGITDPLAAGSRSNSPFVKPSQDANNATGVQTMHLPPAALPVVPPASNRLATNGDCCKQQQLEDCIASQPLPYGHSCSDCSHSSAHLDGKAALATPSPLALFMTHPCADSPTQLHQSQQQMAPAAVPSAQQQVDLTLAATHHLPEDMSPAQGTAAASWVAPVVPAAAAGSSKAWLYQLVTCPFLFKPCPQCSATHNGREVLITYFDPDEPAHGYCTYCPQRASKPRLLQIRRSTYHEVVKAADVSRIADVSGIQHYVINGAKVLFLRPRPQPRPPKGVVAPARCAVDGRQLMDAHSSYCSLRCKLEVEDQIFADNYPSAQEEMEAAAAEQTGDGDGMAGSHLAGTYHRQGGHEGRRVVVPSSKRSATTPHSPAVDQEDGSSEEGDAEHKRAKRQRVLPSKYANALMGGTSTYAAAMAGISKPVLQHGHRHSSHHHQQQHKQATSPGLSGDLPADDTANDQLVDALAQQQHAAAVGMLSMAAMAGGAPASKHAQPVVAAVPEAAASPSDSIDSGRSTTCNQRWNHKRKVVHPHRAPLQ